MMSNEMGFASFRSQMKLSKEEICREIFLHNSDSIKIRKEGVAVRNLSRILDAALKLCNSKGFSSMSLRDLSRESGLSMGAMYSYFRSKEDLLRMIQAQGRSVVLRVLGRVTEGIDDPLLKLRRVIQAHLYASEVLQPWFYLSYMETRNFPRDEYKKSIEAELFTENMLIEIIDSGQKRGLFKSMDAVLLGAVIKSMLQDWYLKRWKYYKRKMSVEQYSEFLLNFIESSILADTRLEEFTE